MEKETAGVESTLHPEWFQADFHIEVFVHDLDKIDEVARTMKSQLDLGGRCLSADDYTEKPTDAAVLTLGTFAVPVFIWRRRR